MFEEKRRDCRVGTHIVAEIGISGEYQKYCGYIENISENGIGIISLDSFEPGEKIDSSFYLSSLPGKISPKASLVHCQNVNYNLHYYGFKFDSLTEKEQRAIEEFVNENVSLNQSA